MNFHNKPKSFALVQAASMPMIRLHGVFRETFSQIRTLDDHELGSSTQSAVKRGVHDI